MKTKKVFFSEAAYAAGMVILAFGTALMEKADFGLSMVVAPAYLFHLKLSQIFPGFSFGMAEYFFQAALLILLSLLLRKFKPVYLFSFVTAVLYGILLDSSLALAGLLPPAGPAGRIVCYVLGMLCCSVGISFLFHTYIPPEAYELVVKELSAKTGAKISVVKTVYDCLSCLLGVVLSFSFFGFGHFEGVKFGTVLCALVNGWLIGKCGRILESLFDFRDAFALRKKFEKKNPVTD